MSFVIKSETEIINDILVNVVTNVDTVSDVNVGAVLRFLVESLGIEVSDLYTQLQSVYDGTRIDTATGNDLDNLGALLGVTRKIGTLSEGDITFIRKTPAAFNFVIPQSSIVSTQPNTSEEQLRFVVNADTTFTASILNESHTFINGIYDYAMDERIIDSITAITGTVLGGPFSFTSGIDYTLNKNVSLTIADPDTITLLDSCDAILGWTPSAGAPAPLLNAIDYKEGTGAIDIGKTTVISTTVYYDKILGAVVDGEGKNLILWFKILNTVALNKINYIEFTIGSGSSIANSYSLRFYQADLVTGWNMYLIDLSLSSLQVLGTPSKSAINYLRVTTVTNLVTDTLASGDMIMDFWTFSETRSFTGDVVSFLQTGTLPDSGTSVDVDYLPLSKEVLCNSEAVGLKYNIGRNKVIYKVSYIANIDSINNYELQTGGSDVESDDDFRERIQLSTQVQAKATATAIQQAVLAIEGIISVSVYDLPLRNTVLEPHTFLLGTDNYALDYEVAINNATLQLSATVLATPGTILVYGTDYILEDSTIKFLLLGTKPDNGTVFFVTYDYNWLGHVDLFVAGSSTPLSPAKQTEVDTTIADTKAAGIVVSWSEPTIVLVNVTVNILANYAAGFTYAERAVAVEDALTQYLNTIDVGYDVYLADIINVCQTLDGIVNTTVTLPAADVVIANSAVARAGTITVNSL